MNKKTLAKLEYNKIIEQLIEHASSFSGKELCRRLKPMTDISAIRNAQDETAAAFTRIVKKDARLLAAATRSTIPSAD